MTPEEAFRWRQRKRRLAIGAAIATLVSLLQKGELDVETFNRSFDGHGAAVHPEYGKEGPFRFVAITGPNRAIARTLPYHEAAPHGDMMLTGAFGLVEGVLMQMNGKSQKRLSLIPEVD